MAFLGGICIGACALLCCFGCFFGYVFVASDPPGLFVANHSGQEVTIELGGERKVIPANGVAIVPYPKLRRAATIRTEKGEAWKYRAVVPAGCELRIQVEPDGSLYYLTDYVDKPVDELPQQPAGFPIQPE